MQAPYSGLPLPEGFKDTPSWDFCKLMSAPGDVDLVGTLTLVSYSCAIIDFLLLNNTVAANPTVWFVIKVVLLLEYLPAKAIEYILPVSQ